MDKYTDSPSNTSIHFHCNKATGFGPLQNYHQAVKQKLFKKANMHTKYTLHLFFWDLKNHKKNSSYVSLLRQFLAVVT